jgi:hypothetical protein
MAMLKDVKTPYMPLQTAKALIANSLGNEEVPEIWEHIAGLLLRGNNMEADQFM